VTTSGRAIDSSSNTSRRRRDAAPKPKETVVRYRIVGETRTQVEQVTGDWTPVTEADARCHEALARATRTACGST
jgi:hypothetical protein